MIQYHENGKFTGWLSSDKPTIKELNRLSIDQLLILAKRKKKSLKQTLINHLING